MTRTNDNGIDRDMTEAEQEAHTALVNQLKIESAARAQAETERAAARQAVLDKLGLTANEAAALLG